MHVLKSRLVDEGGPTIEFLQGESLSAVGIPTHYANKYYVL